MDNFTLGAQINFSQEKREGRMGFTLDCGSKEEQLDKWKETDGDCVEANFKKFWELGTKFGYENFAMVEQQTYPLSKEGFVEDAKLMKEDFVIHHLVLNKKLNVVMDFSNNRTIMVDYDTYKKEFNCSAWYIDRDGKRLYHLTRMWIKLVQESDDFVSKFDEFMSEASEDGRGASASLIYLGYSCHHAFQCWWRRRYDKPSQYSKEDRDILIKDYLPVAEADQKSLFDFVLNKNQVITQLD
jgi:hypothetical protein